MRRGILLGIAAVTGLLLAVAVWMLKPRRPMAPSTEAYANGGVPAIAPPASTLRATPFGKGMTRWRPPLARPTVGADGGDDPPTPSDMEPIVTEWASESMAALSRPQS